MPNRKLGCEEALVVGASDRRAARLYIKQSHCYQRRSMKHTSLGAVATAVALTLGTGSIAAEVEHALEIGQKAPDFKLHDQTGKERSLRAMLKKSKVAVVFHRSADW